MSKRNIKYLGTIVLIIYILLTVTGFKAVNQSKKSTTTNPTKNISVQSATPENKKSSKTSTSKKANVQSLLDTQSNQSETNNSAQTGSQSQVSSKLMLPKLIETKSFVQLDPLSKGDEVAVVKTNYGTIKIKLLPEYAPKTVAYFKERVSGGYYNGTDFYRVIPKSIIQGGQQSQNNSSSNESLDAFNPDVRNFRGAVSLVYSDAGNPQDQFAIVQADASNIVKDTLEYMINSKEDKFPKYVINEYKKIGGAPWSDFNNVVFGQVIKGKQGLDVVDQIMQLGVDESNKPKKEVKIIKITIVAN